jgi:predicted phosphodiesterase
MFGDPHGDFEPVLRAVQTHRPEAVILLGDLQPRQPLETELAAILQATEIWFIHGNHDTDSERYHDNLWGSALRHRNLDGRVQQIAGLLVAGLGGIFRESVWYPRSAATGPSKPAWDSAKDMSRCLKPAERWRGGISLRHRSTIFPDVYRRLESLKADILITHEAPSLHRHGFEAIDRLADGLQVSALVHGHHHEDVDYAARGKESGKRWRAWGVDKGSFLEWA